MKIRVLLLAVVMAFSAALPTSAADGPDKRPSREEMEKRKEDWKKLSPEEQQAKRDEFKARLEKRVTELREKQTAGTISEKESRELVRSEQLLKRFDQKPPGQDEPPKVKEPAAPAPKCP